MESDTDSAALYINNCLVSQGFIRDSERLQLGDSDKSEDSGDGENYRRIINVIYGLLNKVERDSKDKEQIMLKLKEQQRELDQKVAKIDRLNAKCEASGKQLFSVEKLNNALESSLASAKNKNDESKAMIAQLKLVVQKTRLQFANELRKRDMEISRLKERLHDPRKVKTIRGVSGSLSISYNSYKGHANSPSDVPGSTRIAVKSAETSKEKIAVQKELIALNQQLVSENATLLDILHNIQDGFVEMVYSTSLTDKLPEFHLDGPSDAAGVTQRSVEAKQLGKRISICIDEVTNMINSPNFVSLIELREKEQQVNTLKEELKEMTVNWKKAITTLDQWKKYKEKRERPWNILPDSPPRFVRKNGELGSTLKSPDGPASKSIKTVQRNVQKSKETFSSTVRSSEIEKMNDENTLKSQNNLTENRDSTLQQTTPIVDRINQGKTEKDPEFYSTATVTEVKPKMPSTLLTPTKASQIRRSETLRNQR